MQRRRSRVLGCALAAAAACLGAPGTALADPPTLTTDAGTSPLATVSQLAPGVVVERCVVVTTTTQYVSADLGMYVTASGGLADHLTVTIETGTGGDFDDCTGFTGRLVYVGTLGGLTTAYDASRPERVGHFATDVSTVTLRLRFAVQNDNAAQGQSTSASFWWLPVAPLPVVTATTPPDTPQPSGPPTTTAPAPVLPETPAPGPTSSKATHQPPATAPEPGPTSAGGALPPVVLPTATSTPTPAASASPLGPAVGVPLTGDGTSSPAVAPVGGGGGDDAPSGIVGQLASGLVTGISNAAQTVSTAAAPALKGAAVTSLITLPLVLLFLLVQRVFDRRDPKLALAPSYGDPFLGFSDRHPPVQRPTDPDQRRGQPR